MGIDKADKMLPVVFPSRDPRMYEVLQDEIPLSDFECAVRWFECIWHGWTLERARRDVNGFREQQQQPMLHAVGAAGAQRRVDRASSASAVARLYARQAVPFAFPRSRMSRASRAVRG